MITSSEGLRSDISRSGWVNGEGGGWTIGVGSSTVSVGKSMELVRRIVL